MFSVYLFVAIVVVAAVVGTIAYINYPVKEKV